MREWCVCLRVRARHGAADAPHARATHAAALGKGGGGKPGRVAPATGGTRRQEREPDEFPPAHLTSAGGGARSQEEGPEEAGSSRARGGCHAADAALWRERGGSGECGGERARRGGGGVSTEGFFPPPGGPGRRSIASASPPPNRSLTAGLPQGQPPQGFHDNEERTGAELRGTEELVRVRGVPEVVRGAGRCARPRNNGAQRRTSPGSVTSSSPASTAANNGATAYRGAGARTATTGWSGAGRARGPKSGALRSRAPRARPEPPAHQQPCREMARHAHFAI